MKVAGLGYFLEEMIAMGEKGGPGLGAVGEMFCVQV